MSSVPRTHDELEELIAADVLDGLDRADHDRMVHLMGEHGPDCLDCRRLVSEFREVAADIALVAVPVPMSAGAEEQLMAAIRIVPVTESTPSAPSPEPIGRRPSAHRDRGSRARRWVAAAAVAAAIAVLGVVAGRALAPAPPRPQTLALRGELQGQLTLVYLPGHRDAVLVGAGLPQPESGKVYELWYQPAPGAKMVAAGVFVPSNGEVRTPVTVGPSFVLVAVTQEQGPDGTQQPTQQPVAAGTR